LVLEADLAVEDVHLATAGGCFPLDMGVLLGAEMPISMLVVCAGNHADLPSWGDSER
jgi:hypothetical protein